MVLSSIDVQRSNTPVFCENEVWMCLLLKFVNLVLFLPIECKTKYVVLSKGIKSIVASSVVSFTIFVSGHCYKAVTGGNVLCIRIKK